MRKKYLAFIASLCLLGCSFSSEDKQDELIYFNSDKAWDLLLESRLRCDYWHLSRYFETQMTYAHCAVASSIMVLNALDIEKPVQKRYKNYKLFTQENFFTREVQKIVHPEDVARRGMTLEELTKALNTFPVKAQMTLASDVTLEEFRTLVKTTVKDSNSFLIVDFFRPSLNQIGGGHYSPLAAYNEQEDLVLVMEVSRYKHPPFWVKTEKLFEAMKNSYPSKETRGYILVSK